MKTKIPKIFSLIIRKDPIFITLFYIAFIWIILIITIFFGTENMRKNYAVTSFFTSLIITSIPIIITFYHIKSYRKTLSSFVRLFSLMVQIVLLFGTIYFVEQTLSVTNDLKESNFTSINKDNFPFNDVNNLWYYRLLNNHPDKLETLYYAILSYQDCLHFSLVTSSTVGYGDIVPREPIAKLLVDIQIVLSFIIVAFGIASFISLKSNSPSLGKKLDITEHIENSLLEASNAKLEEWEKYSDYMLHKYRNLNSLIKNEQEKRK